MMLFRDISNASNQVVYMVEGKCLTERIWSRNYQYGDKGDVIIVT